MKPQQFQLEKLSLKKKRRQKLKLSGETREINCVYLVFGPGMCKVRQSLLFAKSKKVKYGVIYFLAKVKVK